jgi:GT2 family glycosyltransferase
VKRSSNTSRGFRQTLHVLNQRYHEAWSRAERLEDELTHIKQARAYRFFQWWQRLSGLWHSQHQTPRPAPFPMEILEDHRVPASGSVSIIILFKNHVDLLRNCLRSLKGGYPIREVLLLDNGSTCPRLARNLDRLRRQPLFQVHPCPGPFHFARLANLGAQRASGDFVLFLNNDVEVLDRDWLEQLLQLGNHAAIGAVGATLLYPDRTIQHAGIFPMDDGQWSHVYRGSHQDFPGDREELDVARTVPAVTGACLLIRRRLFLDMGGFDEKFPLTHNDVELCCRLRAGGFKIAISPHARLWHFESMSRGFSR